MTLQLTYKAALERLGWSVQKQTGGRLTMTKAGEPYRYFLGPSGSFRRGVTRAASRPLTAEAIARKLAEDAAL